MEKYNWSRVLAASILVLASHGAIAAQATLQSGFSNIALGVIDLTPDDGQAAGFSVQGMFTTSFLALNHADYGYQSWTDRVTGVAPFTFEHTLGSTSAAAHGTQIGEFGLNLDIEQASGSTASGTISQTVGLLLAPHSVVTLSGTYLGNSGMTGNATVPYTRTSAQINVTSPGFTDNIKRDFTALGTDLAEVPFWFATANTGDTPLRVTLAFKTDGYMAYGWVPSVPEPSTYAMLGIGLLAIGAAARRRRR